jgi:hypothetical protein
MQSFSRLGELKWLIQNTSRKYEMLTEKTKLKSKMNTTSIYDT